ncbi:BTAD domain-containing putative transcriptional regulator, partial [Anaerotruncus massiliensis (ex Liu et al. 2021)]
IAQKAIIIDQFEERAHITLIDAMIHQGKQQQALSHYNYVTDLFYRELGVSPSEPLRNLYREISKTVNSVETDLQVIKEDLNESNLVKGAYYCEYEVFKNMYRVEARSAARTGQSIFIGLLTVTDMHDGVPEIKLLGKTMKQLLETIRNSLRKGDIVSRFSATQYVLMLPTVTFENGSMVLDRIVKRFRAEHPSKLVKIHSKLLPLDPIM